MKAIKILLLLFIPLLAVSCGNKEEKLKNEYIEACADGNFEKARAAVLKLEPIDYWDAKEGMKYVNDKEIYSLLAHPSRDNDSRILFLYNSYESLELPNMSDVVEVAISMGNENLPEKLIKAGVKVDNDMVKAAVNADMEDLVALMIAKDSKLILDPEVAKYCKASSSIDYDAIKKEYDNLIKNELEEKLKALYNVSIPTRPALGIVKSDHYGDIPSEYPSYKNAVESYNNRCISVINQALEYNYRDIARKALALMKPNLEWNNLGDWCKVVYRNNHSSVYNAFSVKQNTNEIESARKLMNK